MNITIHDVAQEAGVSIKTVSRVINNLPYVSESARAKVLQASEKLHYAPSEEGRWLASLKRHANKATGNIGCILFRTYAKYSEPFFAELLETLDRVLQEANLSNRFIHTLQELENPSLFLRMINPHVVDGCILIGMDSRCREQILRMQQRVKHLVLVANSLEASDVSSIYSDGVKAGYLATQHLISIGHRRIACVTGDFSRPAYSQTRFTGYQQALAEHGILYDEALVREGQYNIDVAAEAADALLTVRPIPTAIFVVSDPMAIGVYKAIQRQGLRIPHDISVTSCDNIWMAGHLNPPLTTIDTDKYELARTAVNILTQEIQGTKAPGSTTILPVTLKERESCGPPPVGLLSPK